MTQYRMFEVVTEVLETELGDLPRHEVAPRGTGLAHRRREPRLILGATVTKHCLANLVPGLPEATTIVHIPDCTKSGKRLDAYQWQQAFWYAAERFGVPMWTQSSLKRRTFYFVERAAFERLVAPWDRASDGPKFAAYGGLLFSEMSGGLPPVSFETEVAEGNDGEDGNSVGPAFAWGRNSIQFRAMALNEDGVPVSIAKGVVTPLRRAKATALNSSQVKVHLDGGNRALRFVALRNKAVTAKPVSMWASVEVPVFLRDTEEVRTFLAGRVKAEVAKLLSLLTEEGRVALLKRLGGLEFGDNAELESAKRAVIEALRSNVPWCREIEERVHRFALREICESIIPSGGIRAKASLLVQSDRHGVGPCAWEDAKCVAFRIPVTGADALVPLPRNPYKRGKGMVVTSEVARLVSGDSDGDRLAVITDREVVDLIRRNRIPVRSGLKPAKTRAAGPLTADFLQDEAIRQVEQSWQVGALTVAGWKAIQEGRYDLASELLELANIQPMTQKWDIRLDGVPFDRHVADKLRQLRDWLKSVRLQWRDKMLESATWRSPRELANARIEPPATHLDACWNAGVEAAVEWDAASPVEPLRLSRVARLIFGENGVTIPGAAWREAREVISLWGRYWAEHGGDPTADHSTIFKQVAEWGRGARLSAIAALLVWRPRNPDSTGFALKWHAVFAAGRATEVLGFHPEVAKAIQAEKDRLADFEMEVAAVRAWIEALGGG